MLTDKVFSINIDFYPRLYKLSIVCMLYGSVSSLCVSVLVCVLCGLTKIFDDKKIKNAGEKIQPEIGEGRGFYQRVCKKRDTGVYKVFLLMEVKEPQLQDIRCNSNCCFRPF